MELSSEFCASATLIMMKVFQVEKLVGKRPLGRPKHRWEIILKRIWKG
jgi:hypothetical protein